MELIIRVTTPFFWRKLLTLKVPPNVKQFPWRVSKGCLLTKNQLRIKRVTVNVLCPTCNAEMETIVQSITTCSFAKACWNKICIMVALIEFSTFSDWLSMVFHRCNQDELGIVAVLSWSFWKCRNELVWNQRGMKDTDVVESAKSLLSK